nr:MAG TPA: hypothetical protein [Caudoviricetes sp.]
MILFIFFLLIYPLIIVHKKSVFVKHKIGVDINTLDV